MKEEFNIKVYQQHWAMLFCWIRVIIPLNIVVNKNTCYTVGMSLPMVSDECFATPQFQWACFVIEGMNLRLLLPDSAVLCNFCSIATWHALKWLTRKGDTVLLPEQVRFLWFLRAADEAQDLEHICEGTTISWLCDENSTAQQKHQEGDPKAHGGNDIAQLKVEVLLDVGHTSQGQDGP